MPRRLRGFALPCLALWALSAPAGPRLPLPPKPDWTAEHVSGELIIGFAADLAATPQARLAARAAIHRAVGTRLVEQFSLIEADHVAIPAGASIEAIAQRYVSQPGVAYVEPNYLWHAMRTPNDTDFNRLYGLHNTGQTGGTAGADIDAVEAWDLTTGSASVIIGVIDSGVDHTHPDLAANMWINPGEIANNNRDDDGNGYIDDVHGYDFANGDGNPMDDNGHGTHCAGTIGGVGNNGRGVAGVNWTVRIMALKFLTAGGSGDTAAAIGCLQYAVANGAHLTSNSWGGAGSSTALSNAIAAAGNAGQLFIAAAGNGGSDGVGDNNDSVPNYPSNYSLANVVAVAATDSRDRLGSFSNYGAQSVDLGAPGVSIWSCAPGNSYQSLSGTSMATPHVAGVAGLLLSVQPNATHQQLRDWLFRGTDSISALSGRCVTGGRLNARRSLELAGGSPPPPPARTLTAIAIEGQASMPENSSQDLSCRASYSDGTSALVEPAWSENQPWATITGTGLLTAGDVTAPSQIVQASASHTEGGVTRTATFNVTVTDASAPPPPPPPGSNDHFANAALLSGASGSAAGSNVGATWEWGEPAHAGVGGGQSVWWRWTAPASGYVVFDTRGSDFDTVLAAYRGLSLWSLLWGPSNDDIDYGSGNYQSQITFYAVAGRTYHLAVDGYGSWFDTAEGRIVLSWRLSGGLRPRTEEVLSALLGEITPSAVLDTNSDGRLDAADLVTSLDEDL